MNSKFIIIKYVCFKKGKHVCMYVCILIIKNDSKKQNKFC